VSNLVFGALADRRGHKRVLELCTLIGGLGVGLAVVAPHPNWFYLVFALIGAQTAGVLLSGLMIALEFTTEAIRPTYIGLNNTVRGIGSGLAPLVGGLVADRVGYGALFVTAFVVSLIGVALLRWWVSDPRYGSAHVVRKEAGNV
jgi:MFS family permease